MNNKIKKKQSNLVKNEIDLGVANAGIPADIYRKIPCTIGFTYMRIEVDGTIKPCCVSRFNMENINEKSWQEVWHSHAYYTWREKLLRIHKEKFHLTNPQWSFCQQCSHINRNVEFAEKMTSKEKK
jgi:radical SAM protein with 4Fe4S-binding SPASM domain